MSDVKTTSAQKRIVKLIYDRWKASLENRDKSVTQIGNNFDDLVNELHVSGIPFQLADDTINEAIVAHYPPVPIAKMVYRKGKAEGRLRDMDFDEFINGWRSKIKNDAKNAFYAYYQLESDTQVAQEKEKKYGSMSKTEYKKQRRHMDAMPVVDLEDIDPQLQQHIGELEAELKKALESIDE